MAVDRGTGASERSPWLGGLAGHGGPLFCVVLGKVAKSPAAAAARGLVMGVVIVVRATIRYYYLRFVDIFATPPTRSSNQPPAAVP